MEDSFFQRVKKLEQVLEHSKVELALIGVKPTYPSSKYGYIVPKEKADGAEYFIVHHFTEKSSEEKAEELIAMNAFWNCGVLS